MNSYPIYIFRPSTIKLPYDSYIELSKSQYGTGKIIKRRPLGQLLQGVTIYNGPHGLTFRQTTNSWKDLTVAIHSHNRQKDVPNLYVATGDCDFADLQRITNVIDEWYNWCLIHVRNVPVVDGVRNAA